MSTIQKKPPIYLDYHATTPVDPRVADVVLCAMTTAFGNANSVEHAYGEEAASLVANARHEVASLVGGDPDGVHFTSGATHSIKLAVAHAVASRPKPLRIAASSVEHQAVLDTINESERNGYAGITWIPVDGQARLDMDALKDICKRGVDLVCVMAANNEVGTLYPIQEVVRMAHEAGAMSLIDTTQAAGRIPIDALAWGITYLMVSAHKIYGPKGVGALIAPPGVQIRPAASAIPGIGCGTPNTPGIAGLGEACRLRRLEMASDEPRTKRQRDRLETILTDTVPGLVINGDRGNRLTNNLHVSVPDVPSDPIIARLWNHVALSSGAACSSGAETPSHVLLAMGLSSALREGAVRIGTGKFTTDDEIEQAGMHIVEAIATVRDLIG